MKTGRDHFGAWFLYVIPVFTAITVTLLLPFVYWLKQILNQ